MTALDYEIISFLFLSKTILCILIMFIKQVTMKIVATTETISPSFIISGNYMTIKGFPGGAMPMQEM